MSVNERSSEATKIMKNANFKTTLVATMLFGLQLFEIVGAGSCKEAKLCCSGRDSACVVQKASPNAIIEGPQDKPCYCDHACIKLGDCCDDFKDTCGVVDCRVSTWSSWSACDNKCGLGTQRRSRKIVSADTNGGKHCPQLEQSRGCRSKDDCRPQNYTASMKELALLLPKDLTSPRRKLDENSISNGYFVVYEVLRATKACARDPSLATLIPDARVCVHCEERALRRVLDWRCQGDGEVEAARWSILSSAHCHGKWKRLEKTEDNHRIAECQPEAPFIFV